MNKLQKFPLLEKRSAVLPITQQAAFISHLVLYLWLLWGKKEVEIYGLNKFDICLTNDNNSRLSAYC